MLHARVEIEEGVYRYRPPENGAGPMWCRGNTCIVRVGGEVFASGLETLPEAKPLLNCVPLLYRRTRDGWRPIFRHDRRTREPSPLCCLPDGRLFLSLNPTIAPPDASEGPAEPLIAELSADGQPRFIAPQWEPGARFTEHSYRSFAADGERGELFLAHNVGMSHAAWAFREAGGAWASRGRIVWPWGAEYEQPQPIRICYPNVQLARRSLFFCGVSDIEEPRGAWRDYKLKLTGREWDYDFRRLFFTWCDDITAGDFHQWTEIASRERTCGWILPCDMHVDGAGNVHILWSERALDERLRDAFFPGERQSHGLHYAVLRDGVVLFRRVIALSASEADEPGMARFQATPDERLFVIYVQGRPGRGARNLVREISPEGALGVPSIVELSTPLAELFTATVRAGCGPSETIDLLGDANEEIRYARIRLEGRSDWERTTIRES